jgi:MoxR-like ATPase
LSAFGATSEAAGPPQALSDVLSAICQVVRGKEEVVQLSLVAALAGGHLLLEDVPGVGKTTLAAALAATLGGTFSRIQFTSDLLPGDITGVTVYDRNNQGFSFREGPLFANVVLADEINRTSPKTQSALFEAMSEGQVTCDGTTRPLPRPFLVLATQNPYDGHGTFSLPDSQLDRFLMRLHLGYPAREAERQVLRMGGDTRTQARAVLTPETMAVLSERAQDTAVPEAVEDFLLDLVERTRVHPSLVRGVSTRGAVALYRAVRAQAFLAGRGFAVFEDVTRLAVPVLAHRILARDGGDGVAVIRTLLQGLRPAL